MSARKLLTEPEAWREIARRFGEGKQGGVGLCHEASRMSWDGDVSDDLKNAMHRRVYAHQVLMRPRVGMFAFGGAAPVRVLAALFLALESENEAKPQQRHRRSA